MRNLALLLLVLFTFSSASAQKIHVKQPYVERLIKTLSADDMQGRKTFEPGIEKAAQVIAQEFGQIGLEPLKGLPDYCQSFEAYRIKPTKITVQLDGQSVEPERVLVLSNEPELNWQSQTADSVPVITVEAAQNLVRRIGEIRKSSTSALVLIDPAHRELFIRYREYLSRGAISLEKPEGGNSYVFVLQKLSVALPDYQVQVQNQTEKLPLSNVVGMIPGKSKPDEIVIFSAHYDHLGFLPPVNGDSIANGADDDASGTTAVIALAKHFAKRKNNARTLIFVAFAAEEIGGYGSQYFSKQLDPKQVVAMFNIEMIGKPSKFGKDNAWVTGFEKSDFGKILQKNLTGSEFSFREDPYPDQNLFYRSDNATLARLGVPAHSISSDQIDIDKLYHSVDDEYESLDVANMTQIIRAIARSARSIVAGADTPSRVDASKLE